MDIHALEESEVREFLDGIEKGTITLLPKNDPQDVYAGDVEYEASNGWHIIIFNDANEWDYIDTIKTPDGRTLNFDELQQKMPTISCYEPSDEIAWKRYGIPGYCRFRCKRCGVQLKRMDLRCLPFLCIKCQRKVQPIEKRKVV